MKTKTNKPMKTERQPLEFYLAQEYPVTLTPDPDGGYLVEVKDLPGCISEGDTAEEAVTMINDARRSWIKAAYECGAEIPLPPSATRCSGRVLVRMPKSLHRQLLALALEEGVSLNQCIVTLLSARAPLRHVEEQFVEFRHWVESTPSGARERRQRFRQWSVTRTEPLLAPPADLDDVPMDDLRAYGSA